jgi:hypothetical protein
MPGRILVSTRRSLILVLVALAASTVALAQAINCPIDGSEAYFTGETKVDVSGKLLRHYMCMMYGHDFWAPAD